MQHVADLDLSANPNAQPRKYPAPPTGHELMALFPPAPPVNVLTGPTSGFFLAEERAFFAKGGKEMVRVRIEVDMPREGDPDSLAKSRQWAASSSSPRSQTFSPQTSPLDRMPSSLPPTNPPRPVRSGPVTVTTQPVFPIVSHSTPRAPPYPLHERRHSVQADAEELHNDPDEAWRRPMPHNQRRRAGKHTKRVVVK
ncbi:hypothetical protein BDY19DRAFT_929694 [Irpex rosettiformis]|uniref:Uncharacterized protein n=1 Tax=Irpex rosettiformis TaxID=378272 RepID=A0ACB8UE75_9APHY|nr:hypothetical protein BDY19DRAFT_929694 [Irpex rosettiformis]